MVEEEEEEEEENESLAKTYLAQARLINQTIYHDYLSVDYLD